MSFWGGGDEENVTNHPRTAHMRNSPNSRWEARSPEEVVPLGVKEWGKRLQRGIQRLKSESIISFKGGRKNFQLHFQKAAAYQKRGVRSKKGCTSRREGKKREDTTCFVRPNAKKKKKKVSK